MFPDEDDEDDENEDGNEFFSGMRFGVLLYLTT
jgi:hypothetical protein